MFSWFPEDVELALGCEIFEPIESHVDGFGLFLFNGACEDATCGDIVGFQWCRGLGVSQFDEALADGQCFLCIEVKGSHFSFGCGCHYSFDDFGKD